MSATFAPIGSTVARISAFGQRNSQGREQKHFRSGGDYPLKWKISVPGEEIELEIAPEFRDQELITNRGTRVTYWEGAVRINGSVGKKAVGGSGYVEMTGYAGNVRF